jgi:hypothetical protein
MSSRNPQEIAFMRAASIIGGMAVAAVAGAAFAQHHQTPHQPAHGVAQPMLKDGPRPFSLAVYGAFRRMMHTQDFSAKVQLKTVMQGGATEAVGAIAGLRGEITAIDGKLLLTYGTPCPTCGHAGEDHATLLASAKVSGWHQPVVMPSDLIGQALDAWIIAQAKAAGLDAGKPFPVRLKGTLTGVKMHVIRAFNSNFKGHGSGHAMADQEEIAADRIEGDVVAFYAPADLQGVITHPGEPFHYHWVDTARTRTAHLDAFGMAKGAQLLLPKH